MKANYSKPRRERIFQRLPQDQKDAIVECADEYEREHMTEYGRRLREELAREYAENILPRERMKMLQLGMDISTMAVSLLLIEKHGWGTRKYSDRLRLPILLRDINTMLAEVMEKHKNDLDMAVFDMNKRLNDYGVNYEIELEERQ